MMARAALTLLSADSPSCQMPDAERVYPQPSDDAEILRRTMLPAMSDVWRGLMFCPA